MSVRYSWPEKDTCWLKTFLMTSLTQFWRISATDNTDDTDTDIFRQSIVLHIGHRYRYRYSHFTDIWTISGNLADILADIHVFSPISYRYRYNRYSDSPIPIRPIKISSLLIKYIGIGIGTGQIYRPTDISV